MMMMSKRRGILLFVTPHAMNTKILLSATILSVFLAGTMGATSVAFAQYMGNVVDGSEMDVRTLDNPIVHPPRIQITEDNSSTGSGISYLDINGAVIASVIAGTVFGGIAGAFFVRGRSGKYAAMGRG